MKLIKTLRTLKKQFLTKLTYNHLYTKLIVNLAILTATLIVLWVAAPAITYGHLAFVTSPEKRFYIIVSVFLLWLLKFILIDLSAPSPYQFSDIRVRKNMLALFNRFYGALQFITNTTVNKQGKSFELNKLPWYLLIGPAQSGKSALLNQSHVNFILQKQAHHQDAKTPDIAEQCDWWITRDATIIDVPGKYINPAKSPTLFSHLWDNFLRLIKLNRGNHGINGIIITLPLPELMQQADPKNYEASLKSLQTKLLELKKLFRHDVPCHLVITKCDLIPGFLPFFNEMGDDEITQAWGFTLNESDKASRMVDAAKEQFDNLIKRINQQLIWRMHQEHNPAARTLIKDFPIELERLKEYMQDALTTITSAQLGLSLQGVYLTSAMQNNQTMNVHALLDSDVHHLDRDGLLFKEPTMASRAYFIKQYLTHALTLVQDQTPGFVTSWKRTFAYAISIGVIAFAGILFGRDFEHSVKKTYAIQNDIANYQMQLQQFRNPNEQMARTVALLDNLQQSVKNTQFKFDLYHILYFYSFKSQEKAKIAYQQALRTILLPEVKSYLEEYLKLPVNKPADNVYAALKAYLMLGDPNHAQADVIINTLKIVMPSETNKTELNHLTNHILLTYTIHPSPIMLNADTISATREFLTRMPNLQLAYIILKNFNSNNMESNIDLGISMRNNAPMFSKQVVSDIPNMFTGKAFPLVVTQEANTAAAEATTGNWVLGPVNPNNAVAITGSPLIDQLRLAYINNYVDVWESLLANIQITTPNTLKKADDNLLLLTSKQSPLMQLLTSLHANTFFEPISAASPKLQSLSALTDRSKTSQSQLYQIFGGLQGLHLYLQPIINASNPQKASFDALSSRMKHTGSPDAITQLRIIAEASPEPVKSWLNKITDDTWRILMDNAGLYLNTAWQNQVTRYYQAEIAHRYPFSTEQASEVPLQKFTDFFGNPGIITNFYHHYLQALVDTSKPEWRWKSLDNTKLPFSDDTLKQVQQALRIHHSFFPNGDNKLYVRFAIQPYQLGDQINHVRIKINDKLVSDQRNSAHSPHVLMWPSNSGLKMTILQLTFANNKTITQQYPGDWGWYKLVNQSYETSYSRNQALVNFSKNGVPAKYLFFTEGQFNPFIALNLKGFNLPEQFT